MIFATAVEAVDMGEALALYAISYVPGSKTYEECGFVLTRSAAAVLRAQLASILDKDEKIVEQQEELPLTSTGDFGAEHEIHDTAGAGWRERFGVSS